MTDDWEVLAEQQEQEDRAHIRARLEGREISASRLRLYDAMDEPADTILASLKHLAESHRLQFADTACEGDRENIDKCYRLVESSCPQARDRGCPKRGFEFEARLHASGMTPQRIAEDAGIPPSIAANVLAGRLVDRPALVAARRWWRDIARRRTLVLWGRNLAGKSTAAAELCINAGGVFLDLRQLSAARANSDDFARQMRSAPLVVFDDLGTEAPGYDGRTITQISNAIAARWDAGALSVVTTNNPDDMSRYTERVTRRFDDNQKTEVVAA